MLEIQLKIKINTTNLSTFADIADQIRNHDLNRLALEESIKKFDELKTTEIAGPKYSRENDHEIKRAGTTSSSFLSDFGRISLDFNRVSDGEKTRIVLKSLLEKGDVQFSRSCEGNLRFIVSQLTFRRSCRIVNLLQGNGFTKDVLWDTVKALGIEASETYDANQDDYDLVLIDGSGKKGKEWFVVVGINSKTMKKTLLHHSVGCTIAEIKGELDFKNLINKEKHIIVADAEPQIHSNFKGYQIQLCILHFEGYIGYSLWNDGMSKEERRAISKEVKEIISTLKNSVIKNTKNNDKKRLEKRIKKTKKRLKNLAGRILKCGYETTYKFIIKHIDTVTLFAKEAFGMIKIPWTNNIMERLMGEIAFRVKNIWAHWSKKGLNSILHLILTDYCKRGVSSEF